MGGSPGKALALMLPLRIHHEAEHELAEAITWYEERREGVGRWLQSAVDEALRRVQENPRQFQSIDPVLRRAPVERFPFSIIYSVSPEYVLIVAVFHGKRDPRRWQNRVGDYA